MLVHPDFNPIALSLGPLAVRWYGLMYVIGFIAFIMLGKWRIRHGLANGLTERDVDDMLVYGVFGVILGGRLGYVLFYKPMYYLEHPLEIFAVWQGGMSFHGGLLGVLLALWLYSRKRHKRWLDVTDFVAPLVPLGLAAGRLGNFINGELWGRATDASLPWAMIFPHDQTHLPRHPSQLYEAGMEGILLFTVLAIMIRFGALKRPGMILGAFILIYGLTRIAGEHFREPDEQLGFLWGGLTMGMLLSIPMLIVGGILIVLAVRRGAPKAAESIL